MPRQVVLHLNIARCLLEQRDQLDKAEWHCFMVRAPARPRHSFLRSPLVVCSLAVCSLVACPLAVCLLVVWSLVVWSSVVCLLVGRSLVLLAVSALSALVAPNQAMTLHPMGANASEVGNRAALEETEQEQEQEGSMRSLVSSVTSKITSMFSGSGRGSGAAEAESVAASGVQASAGCSQPDTAAKSQKLFAKILFFRARVLLARK